jgi:polyhydroxyalkanoate synthase
VVFVPSLINPPLVLDLARGNSLLRWLARQGMRPLLVDWGAPGPEDRQQDVTWHVERFLLPLLATLDRPPVLAGYCLGGTMALAAAARVEAAGLASIAAPWRFEGYAEGLDAISALWDQARAACDQLGLVPMEVLQAGFWQLVPARTVAKFERFGRLKPDSAEARAFVALEDWANGGAPLPFAAGRQLFDDFLCADLPGSGRWRVGGEAVTPEQLACPALSFVSTTDRIVPAASALALGDVRRLPLGHVGMVVGGRARGALWEPLRDWITMLHRTK